MNGLAGNSKKELEIKNSASVSLDKKNEITHTEFMNFLEPFFEIIVLFGILLIPLDILP